MKKADIAQGRVYVAKVSGHLARVRIVAESPYGGWIGRNEDTGRDVRIKSAARLRREYVVITAIPPAQKVERPANSCARCGQPVHDDRTHCDLCRGFESEPMAHEEV